MTDHADPDADVSPEAEVDDRPRRSSVTTKAKAAPKAEPKVDAEAEVEPQPKAKATTSAGAGKARAGTGSRTSTAASSRGDGIAKRRAPTPAAKLAAAAAPARPAEGRRIGGAGRLPWVLAALGLVGTLVFGGLWLSGRGDDAVATGGGEEAVVVKEAADRFSLALTNFDGATIDADFDRIVDLATGDFRDEVGSFFSAETRTQLKEAQASSRGEVRSSYVQGVDGDRASAFVVLDQTIANNKSPQPKADTLRMELALALVDGTWLVQQVNVLEAPGGGASIDLDPTDDPATTPTAPGAVTTTTAGG